ncbi:MAG: rRNA maturation RNase YbeY [Pseudolabrys sp.]
MPALSRRAGPPSVDIQIQSPLWNAQPQAAQTIRDVLAAAAALIATADGEVGIVLTDDKTIRALNRQWRGIDKPTNVLSFPAAITQAGVGARFFGDIVMAYETLARESDDENRAFLHHLAHLTIHGFLHLIGYGHEVDAEAEKMEGLESKIMMRMNLPDPWLGRHLDREFGNV